MECNTYALDQLEDDALRLAEEHKHRRTRALEEYGPDSARRTGRTSRLLASLPADGRAILVVHDSSFKWYIRDLIEKIHGRDYPMKELKIITPSYIICGYSWPIFIDHFVWEAARRYPIDSEYNRGLSRIIEYKEWQTRVFQPDASSRSSQTEISSKHPVLTLTSRTHRWIRSNWAPIS